MAKYRKTKFTHLRILDGPDFIFDDQNIVFYHDDVIIGNQTYFKRLTGTAAELILDPNFDNRFGVQYFQTIR